MITPHSLSQTVTKILKFYSFCTQGFLTWLRESQIKRKVIALWEVSWTNESKLYLWIIVLSRPRTAHESGVWIQNTLRSAGGSQFSPKYGYVWLLWLFVLKELHICVKFGRVPTQCCTRCGKYGMIMIQHSPPCLSGLCRWSTRWMGA